MNRGTIFIARERENVMSEPVAALAQEAPDSARWRNPYAILPTLRWVVQGAYLFFFVLGGIEFHSFYRQIVSGGPVTAHRPPAVEGFLPISILVGLKRFLLTGHWHTSLSLSTLSEVYQVAASLVHP